MALETYKVDSPENFTDEQKATFVKLLIAQKKVRNPSLQKIRACKLLAACFISDNIVSIGAIKPKTESDFSKHKADMEDMTNDFEFELGYCYTATGHTEKGYGSEIVNKLLAEMKGVNLIASTEMEGSKMRGILERRGFVHKGKTWKSGMHGGELGLFIKIPR